MADQALIDYATPITGANMVGANDRVEIADASAPTVPTYATLNELRKFMGALDTDADAYLHSPADDQFAFNIGAADIATFSATGLDMEGNSITAADDVGAATGTFTGAISCVGAALGSGSITGANDVGCATVTATGVVTCAGVDLAGSDLILDADNDSYLHASGDDVVDLVVGGSTIASFTSNSMTLNGSPDFTGNNVILDDDNDTYLRTTEDDHQLYIAGVQTARYRTTLIEFKPGGTTSLLMSATACVAKAIYTDNATGGYKGADTINASAIYDDNVQLTDYVFDFALDGELLPEDADRVVAQAYVDDRAQYTNARSFTNYWQMHRHLPAYLGRIDWTEDKRPSIGALAQQHHETIETMAVIIGELLERIEELEKRV